MTPVRSPDDPHGRRDRCTRRAVAAAVAVARSHGLEVTEPTVLNDLFSVMVHLRPAPVVARVPTWITRLRGPARSWLEREIAVTAFLAGQGAPVVAPSQELPPGPHTRDGFTISFWTYLQPDPDRTPTTADCSAMLVDLHAELRAYPGELPPLRTTVVDLPRWLGMLDEGAAGEALSAADIDRLQVGAAQAGMTGWTTPLRPGLPVSFDGEQITIAEIEGSRVMLRRCGAAGAPSWRQVELVALLSHPGTRILVEVPEPQAAVAAALGG